METDFTPWYERVGKAAAGATEEYAKRQAQSIEKARGELRGSPAAFAKFMSRYAGDAAAELDRIRAHELRETRRAAEEEIAAGLDGDGIAIGNEIDGEEEAAERTFEADLSQLGTDRESGLPDTDFKARSEALAGNRREGLAERALRAVTRIEDATARAAEHGVAAGLWDGTTAGARRRGAASRMALNTLRGLARNGRADQARAVAEALRGDSGDGGKPWLERFGIPSAEVDALVEAAEGAQARRLAEREAGAAEEWRRRAWLEPGMEEVILKGVAADPRIATGGPAHRALAAELGAVRARREQAARRASGAEPSPDPDAPMLPGAAEAAREMARLAAGLASDRPGGNPDEDRVAFFRLWNKFGSEVPEREAKAWFAILEKRGSAEMREANRLVEESFLPGTATGAWVLDANANGEADRGEAVLNATDKAWLIARVTDALERLPPYVDKAKAGRYVMDRVREKFVKGKVLGVIKKAAKEYEIQGGDNLW